MDNSDKNLEEQFDEKLCDEKHKNLDSIVNDHEIRLNKHAQRLDDIEHENVELKNELKHLCEDLKSLTSVLKWFIGVLLTTLIGFFITMVSK